MNTCLSIFALALCAGISAVALADEAATVAKAQATATATEPHNCPHDTGSRVKRADDACMPVPGQAYTREELQSTGANNLADALRRLSTALR
ncbi:MAG: hypothetical protein QM661_04520 [Solimonas sp.]